MPSLTRLLSESTKRRNHRDNRDLKQHDAFNKTWWSILSVDKLVTWQHLSIKRTGQHVVFKASACSRYLIRNLSKATWWTGRRLHKSFKEKMITHSCQLLGEEHFNSLRSPRPLSRGGVLLLKVPIVDGMKYRDLAKF